ncbi:hypothetical protein [Mangrovibacterium diazotrophicum]|uniref:Uncharacterized protein n=1 Tax=Mangrovibacterium diazotrophicum TaxID=1261403 RepID=A0A419VW79_9BACT|nr:hypothetical protein [Mangrovibacterium diazotrophicum]RKD86410.1 hypothetical protein BC643_4101 [Mangrovibacterium diazotrophicum]
MPVNTTLSTEVDGNGDVSTKGEVSVGVDNENVSAKAYISVSSSTESSGEKTNEAAIGLAVEIPIAKDGKTTYSVGTVKEAVINF